MKKDIEWLKEQFTYYREAVGQTFNDVSRGMNNAYDNVEKLIDQLDEPEQTDIGVGLSKPVVPQFVADWIDTHNLYGSNPLKVYRDLDIDFNEGWTDEKDAAVYHWINKNPYAFIDALRYGYEVAKEKKYYVYDKSTKGYLGYNADKTRLSWYTSQFPNDVFTEQEIKAIDKRYWAFAEEVTEW